MILQSSTQRHLQIKRGRCVLGVTLPGVRFTHLSQRSNFAPACSGRVTKYKLDAGIRMRCRASVARSMPASISTRPPSLDCANRSNAWIGRGNRKDTGKGLQQSGRQPRRPYFGGCSSLDSHRSASDFSGSGRSQSRHCNVRGSLPPDGSARIKCAPQCEQVGRLAWPIRQLSTSDLRSSVRYRTRNVKIIASENQIRGTGREGRRQAAG
jgi:hypothetical protein